MPAACTALAPISFLSDAFLYSSCLRIVASRLRLAISAATRLLLEVQSRTNRFPRTHAPLTFSSSLSSFVCMSSPLHPQSLAHLGIPTFVTGWARRSCASRNESTRRDPLYYLTLVSFFPFRPTFKGDDGGEARAGLADDCSVCICVCSSAHLHFAKPMPTVNGGGVFPTQRGPE